MNKRETIGAVGGFAWLLMDGLWMMGDLTGFKLPWWIGATLFGIALVAGIKFFTHSETE